MNTAVTATLTSRCSIHNTFLVVEPGGVDMPTVPGRTYCPTCQMMLVSALDRDEA